MATQQIQVELKDLEDWDEDGVGECGGYNGTERSALPVSPALFA